MPSRSNAAPKPGSLARLNVTIDPFSQNDRLEIA